MGLFLSSCSSTGSKQDLKVVQDLDLNKYLGTWYEIARLPAWFQKNCIDATATYSFRKDGKIKVENKCFENTPNKKLKQAIGKAWVVDKTTNAKLKVSFFWPFAGDYYVIDLDDKNYQYSVVGEPSRKYLWILSRNNIMEKQLLDELLEKIKFQGYNLEKLIINKKVPTF